MVNKIIIISNLPIRHDVRTMKFQVFWELMKKELVSKKQFQTIARKKSFMGRYVSGDIEVTSPTIKGTRSISQKEFLRVWELAKNFNKGEQMIQSNYSETTYNASYITALMSHYLKGDTLQ